MTIAPERRRISRRWDLRASGRVERRRPGGVLPSRGGDNSEAWGLVKLVPELYSAMSLISDSTSRADLYVAERTPDGLVRAKDPEVSGLLDQILGTSATQGEPLRRLTLLLEVTGEAYLAPTEQGYFVVNRSEMQTRNGGLSVMVDIDEALPLIDDPLRIWYPDSEFAWRPYSIVIGMQGLLTHIGALQARMTAVAESRAAGNGLIGIPDELNVIVPQSHPDSGVNYAQSPDVGSALEEAMLTPMQDRDHASSVVPLLLTGPGEHLKNIIRIDMASPLDQYAPDQLEQALRRMAVSLRIPPELVTGLGATNHWSAESIMKEAVTTAFEPRIDSVADALTHAFLRPALSALGLNPAKYVIAYDLTDLKVRPDRSEQADKAHDAGLLTDEAWARHIGFDAADLATGREKRRLLLEGVLRRDPGSARWVLPELGIPLSPQLGEEPSAVPEPSPPVAQDTPIEVPDLSEPSERPLAASIDPEEALLAALESAVLRVLERTGNRLVGRAPRELRARLKQVPLTAVHAELPPLTAEIQEKALQGAFDTWDVHLPWLAPVVRSYVEHLLATRQPHSQELLRAVLDEIDLAALAAAEPRSSR